MEDNTAVFISYRREDSRAYAGRLYDHLSAHFGARNVFMDVANIEPGGNFVRSLSKNLASCGALVVVIGKQWCTLTDNNGYRRLDDTDDFVRQEIATALRSKLLIVPALVEGAQMPKADQLPADIAPLAHRNALELSDTLFRPSVAHLIDILQQRVSPYSGVPRIRKLLLLYRPLGHPYWVAAGWFLRAVILLLSFFMLFFACIPIFEPLPNSQTRTLVIVSLVIWDVVIFLVVLVVRKAGSWCDERAVRIQRRHLCNDL